MDRAYSKNGPWMKIEEGIFESKPEGRRRMSRPRLRWLEDDERGLREMNVKR